MKKDFISKEEFNEKNFKIKFLNQRTTPMNIYEIPSYKGIKYIEFFMPGKYHGFKILENDGSTPLVNNKEFLKMGDMMRYIDKVLLREKKLERLRVV